MYKRLIMILLVLSMVIVLIGCDNKNQVPDGVGQDFYNDMINCLKKLEKYKDNEDKNGRAVVDEYLENKIWLSATEKEIIESMDETYFWIWMYYNTEGDNVFLVRNHIINTTSLLGVKTDINKFIN